MASADGTTSTVTVNILGTNDASILTADTKTVTEDTAATGNVLTNDSDVDNTLTVSSFTVNSTVHAVGTTATIAGKGTLTIAANGDYTFTPAANWNGTVPQVTYTVSTGSTSTLDITVTAVNDAAVLVADNKVVTEDTTATGNVLTNDNDVDSTLNVASFRILDDATVYTAGQTASITGIGTLTNAANGAYTFTPVANWNGSVPEVTYTVTTGETSTLAILLTPVDDASVLVADTKAVVENITATGNVLTNDSDVDNTLTVATFKVSGDVTAYVAGTTATITGKGTLTIAANGDYTFTPVAGWSGTVPQATYTVNTGSTSTLNISVTPADHSPGLAADSKISLEDAIGGGNVLANDNNASSVTSFQILDNATVYTAGQTATIAGVGTLTISANGDYTFTPVANWNGAVPEVTYTASNGETSTLSILLTPVDDPSVLVADTKTVAEDTAATGNVLTNDSDVDNTLTVATFKVSGDATVYTFGQSATITGKGSVTIAANGDYSFTPVANWNGTVPQVTYTVSTGSTSTLDITVTPVNDASVMVADSKTVSEDTAATGNVLTNDSDVDNTLTVTTFQISGDAMAYTAGATATITGVGTLTIAANGAYTFTPVANWNGAVPEVTYTANSGETSTLSILLTPVDDPSVLVADTDTVVRDTTATGNVLANDSDVDYALTVSSFTINSTVYAAGASATIAGKGTLTIAENGDYSFVPAAGWSGSVPEVTYTVSTGSTSTLNISVTSADQTLGLVADSKITLEDVTAGGNVLANDSSASSVTKFQVLGDSSVYSAGQTATLAGIGTLKISANGDYIFTPVANWNGSVPEVTYTANNGGTSTLGILLTPVDDPSVLVADTKIVGEDSIATGNVLTNDSDVDNILTVATFRVSGDATVYTFGQTATISGKGTLTIAANGDYTFTPVANWNGTVPQVTYTVSTGSISTLAIDVTQANAAPVATPDTGVVGNTAVLTVDAAHGVLANDYDPDSADSHTVSAVNGDTAKVSAVVAGSGGGTFVIGADGSYIFTPGTDFDNLSAGAMRTSVASYTIRDSSGLTSTSTLTVTVTGVKNTTVTAPVPETTPGSPSVPVSSPAVTPVSLPPAAEATAPAPLATTTVTLPAPADAAQPSFLNVVAPSDTSTAHAAEASKGTTYQGTVNGAAASGLSTGLVIMGGTDRALGGEGLSLMKTPSSQESLTNVTASFSLPDGMFRHSDSYANVTVVANLSDGRPLPTWMTFDPASGRFTAKPPADSGGTLDIKISARDQNGNVAETQFTFRITETKSSKPAAGDTDTSNDGAVPKDGKPNGITDDSVLSPQTDNRDRLDPRRYPPAKPLKGRPSLTEQLAAFDQRSKMPALFSAAHKAVYSKSKGV